MEGTTTKRGRRYGTRQSQSYSGETTNKAQSGSGAQCGHREGGSQVKARRPRQVVHRPQKDGGLRTTAKLSDDRNEPRRQRKGQPGMQPLGMLKLGTQTT